MLCARPAAAFGYITDGWANALRDRGHEVARWDGEPASWRSYGHHLYIGCSGHKQPIPKDRDCKVAIHVNPYGPVKVKGIDEPQEGRAWTLAQRPDAVFGYGLERDRFLWSYWTEKHGVPWVPMATAGDVTQFSRSAESARRHDLVYLGGRWPYKGKTIDKYLIPVIRSAGVSSRVHGWGEWPDGMCSGQLSEHRANEFLGSGRVGPCMSEPHVQAYGFDVPERVFKLALCGTLPIHDPVPGLGKSLPGMPMASNPEEYKSLIVHYSRPENSQERVVLADRVREATLSAHTYHHRMSGLLRAVGFEGEADGMTSGAAKWL